MIVTRGSGKVRVSISCRAAVCARIEMKAVSRLPRPPKKIIHVSTPSIAYLCSFSTGPHPSLESQPHPSFSLSHNLRTNCSIFVILASAPLPSTTTSTMAFVASTPASLASAARGRHACEAVRSSSSSSSTFTRRRPAAATPLRHQSHQHRNHPQMVVIDVCSIADMDQVLEGADNSLVVVDYSTTWCGPCKIFAPIFEEMSEKHSDVVFVKVIGDASPDASELMRREGIRAVPAFHFWKDRKRVKDITGARKDDVEAAIVEYKDAKPIQVEQQQN